MRTTYSDSQIGAVAGRFAVVRLGSTAVGLICGVSALIGFCATTAPGVAWQDSGVHQYRVLFGQLDSPFGLALSHPLHYWIGRAVVRLPLGEPAYALNLMSALFGAIGVGVMAATVMSITASAFASFLAAVTLASAHSYWQMSTVTETYTLAAALMTVEWLLLLQFARGGRPVILVAVFAVNGLHVADHMLGTLTLAPYGVLLVERIIRGKLHFKWAPAALTAWLVTASPYWSLIVVHWRMYGDLAGSVHSALFGGHTRGGGFAGDVLNLSISFGLLRNSALAFAYNFPSLAALVALAGITARRDGPPRLFRIVLIAQTALIFAFVARYPISDLYTYFVPICALVAVWFGLGCNRLVRAVATSRKRSVLVALLVISAAMPILMYSVFPVVAQKRGWLRSQMRDIAYRDEYRHFFRPWQSGDDSAEMFAGDALSRAGPGGWVLADTTTGFSIAYVQRVHGGPDGARVYRGKKCLDDPGLPELTAESMRQHLELGGKIIAVPHAGASALWGEDFEIDKTGRFWRVRLRGIERGARD